MLAVGTLTGPVVVVVPEDSETPVVAVAGLLLVGVVLARVAAGVVSGGTESSHVLMHCPSE